MRRSFRFSAMDELADSIKTKSLSEALEPLTEQVLEISSLTIEDIEKLSDAEKMLQHLSDGLRSSSQNFMETILLKLKHINPTANHFEIIRPLQRATEAVAASSLTLLADLSLLEPFQEKIADLLEVIMKMILHWDRELINVLQQMLANLRKPLIGLRKTQILHEVLCLYKEFTKQFLEFSEELQHRVRDLIDRKIRNEFWITLICLQRLATSFTQVIKNIARYPLSRHIRISKEFVVKELLVLLDELERLLIVDEPSESNKHAGSFIGTVDEVLDTLERSHLDEEGLEWKIHLILQHSMTVSKFSSDDDRALITHHCQRVLNEHRSLQNALNNLETTPIDIPLAVDVLRDLLELLEQSVNHSLLRMMVENLSACTDPLRNLILRCSSAKMDVSGSQRATLDLQYDVQQFDSATERVLQTGFFALASTADFQKIQAIRSALKMLECLEAEIVPAVYNCYMNPTDQSSQCHLQFLWRSFHDNYNHLQNSLDSIADVAAFCHVAEKFLADRLSVLRASVYTQDVSFLEHVCRQIIATAHRSWTLLRQQDSAKKSMNHLYLNEINLALEEFRGAFTLTLDNIGDVQAHRSMMKRAEILLKYLMKSSDVVRRMQDSELADSTLPVTSFVQDLASVVVATPGPTFPANVSVLPIDQTTPRGLSHTKIGRTPNNRRGGRSTCEPTAVWVDDDTAGLAEITRFASTTQPWRTRCTTFAPSQITFGSDSEASQTASLKMTSETFDLTDILEELTTLEGTLTSTRAVSQASNTTPRTTNLTLDVSINTPHRLQDLQIVARRLALLRQQKMDS